MCSTKLDSTTTPLVEQQGRPLPSTETYSFFGYCLDPTEQEHLQEVRLVALEV